MVVVTEAGILSQNMIFFKPWRVFFEPTPNQSTVQFCHNKQIDS